VAGVGPIGSNLNVENSLTNFAPRLGIAWQFHPKTVLRMGYGRSFDIGVFGSIFGHSVTQNLPVLARQEVRGPGGNNFEAAFNLAVGPSAFAFPTVPDTGVFPLPSGANQFIQNAKMRLPTIDTWNVTIARGLTNTMSAEIAYVGNKGTHGFVGNNPDYNCNQPEIQAPGDTRTSDQRRRFFAAYGWKQDLRCHLNDASNNYHALQTKFDKRFSHGVQFQANYTWAKGLNFDPDYYTNDPFLNHGLDDFNRKHVLALTGLFELPFGRGKRFANTESGVLDRLVGGWQLNTVTRVTSGPPFSPTYKDCGADRDTGPCRPNLVGSVDILGDRDKWFTTAGVLELANLQTAGPW
jgi:hypothetical protein